MAISIHAPTRGATKTGGFICFSKSFQSTLPRGERHVTLKVLILLVQDFNPRSHEGSDCKRRMAPKWNWYFNPRSHEGSDLSMPVQGHGSGRFQSTLPRGERLRGRNPDNPSDNFNPRSHEGSDQLSASNTKRFPISIHAPTRGATYVLTHLFFHGVISIHAPTRGATQT